MFGLFVAIYPIFAYASNAGIFSLPFIFGSKSVDEKEEVIGLNSQNIALLQAAVNLDPNPIKGGGDINVVDQKALLAETGLLGSAVEADENTRTPDQISIYEVREGDTLSQIADMFQVSVNTIRWANEMEGPISPGQRLVILPISGISHTVKSGGTISDIAKIYDADAKEIALFNGISVDTYLEKGTKILVPNATPNHDDSQSSSEGSAKKKVVSSGGSSSSSYSGYYMRPIKGGYRSQGVHGYNAVDLAAPVGTPIYAAASGRVIISQTGSWNGGYGNYIVIKHDNGTQTLYAHNTSNAVTTGQWVSQGDVIGSVGSTGKSTGPHLHFEVRGATNPF